MGTYSDEQAKNDEQNSANDWHSHIKFLPLALFFRMGSSYCELTGSEASRAPAAAYGFKEDFMTLYVLNGFVKCSSHFLLLAKLVQPRFE
jgi:hypothetical protein